MQRRNHCSELALVFSLVLSSLPPLWAGPPKLAPPTQESNGDYRLHLQGDAEVHYLLEQSENLQDWDAANWGLAPTGGMLEWTRVADPTSPAMFFRARVEAPDEVPAAVTPETDANLSVEGMADELGGELTLFDHDGAAYRLWIPSNAVPEAVTIRMTLATNLIGYPLDGGEQRSLVFEPKGLEFDVPATLFIEYPAETSLSNHVSFWYEADGTDFGLVPDLVVSNTIAMPVYHFSGYGNGKASGASLASQAQRRVGDPFQKLNQQIASQVAEARRAGKVAMDNTHLPSDLEASIAAEAASVIQREFLRQAQKLSTDCAFLDGRLSRIGWLLGLGARYGLTSPAYTEAAAQLQSAACAGLDHCFATFLAECKTGKPEGYRKFVALQARQQSIGLQCADRYTKDDFKACRQIWDGFAWNGHTETSGETNKSDVSESMSSVKLHWIYKGAVVNVDDQRSPPGGLISVFTVNFAGLLSVEYQLVSSSANWGCEGGKDRNSQRTEQLSVVSGTLKTNVNVDLTIMITPLGTNVFLTQSALLYLPRISKDFVLRTDCLGNILQQEWTEFAGMLPLNIQLDFLSNPEPTFNLAPNLVTEHWTPDPRAGLNAFWNFNIEKTMK